ncbi:hypothetical protein [Shewanella sp. OMA3-2]|uniref:hypothetical protein n=1 Tax=Shewanella sp. OMA3-2 TaxID=2908650 RepID=UPI001F164DE4|nr:hypothetical protein [Shewanella sp. OMA3-2]UJF23189.1 hypothetical protein L0B17_07580 [Shewanella sp. OMA3-2]
MIFQLDWLLLSLVLVVSSVFLGFSAYYAGLAVKRWAFLGVILGPVAYLLFNTHKHLAYRKVEGARAHRVNF